MADNPSFHRDVKKETIRSKELKEVKGLELDDVTATELLEAYETIGYQATHLSKALKIIKRMQEDNAKIFLTFTSNIISSGLREVVAQLCKHELIEGIVTSTGSIEEDFMKTQAPFYIGKFELDDTEVQANAMNRIGNVLVKDESYANFEEWHMKFMEKLYGEKRIWAPSEYIERMGQEIDDENSFLYWAAKNQIPIYCPGFVDGAMGDHWYFYNKRMKKQDKETLVTDTTADVDKFYDQVLAPEKIGGVILGGGIAKHHFIGAAILRDGMDYAVYVTTASEYDGSLSGAKPEEAISWNKLKTEEADNHVEVHADATLVFPLLAIGMMKNG